MRIIFKSVEEVKQKYEIGEILGTGTFSEVRLGINKETKERVAIKVIEPKDKEEEEMIRSEIRILEKLDHPHIINIIEVFERPSGVLKSRRSYIVTELVTGGELLDRIIQKKYYLESEARVVMQQLLEVVEYVHAQGIVHRDIKPGNILYVNDEEDSPIKLVDFGCATVYDPNSPLTDVLGTPAFVAPEVISIERGGYGKEADMWSIGVMLYILLCGFPPFAEDDDEKLFAQIREGRFSFPSPYWDNVSDEAMDLVTQLLQLNVHNRATAADALKHPWMAAGRNVMRDYRKQLAGVMGHMTQRRFQRLTNCVIAVNKLQRLNREK